VENACQIATEMANAPAMVFVYAMMDLLDQLANINIVFQTWMGRRDLAKFVQFCDFRHKYFHLQNQGYCKDGKCQCATKHTHGDYCQELALNPIWDTVLTFEPKHFQPRASHKTIVIGNELWIQGFFKINKFLKPPFNSKVV
jgi:hypothetical protein